MPVKVLDTSVLAAWCFQEPREAEARALMADSDLYAPHLMAYELTNIARRKAIEEPTALVHEGLKAGLGVAITWTDVDHEAVLRLALANNLTAYDASYLFLARVLDAPLVTFDRRLARVAEQADI